MKTITDGTEVRRVSDADAESIVSNRKSWEYCPKSLWKKQVRDKGKKEAKK